MDPKILKHMAGGVCPICNAFSGLPHQSQCMFETHNARWITSGIRPENKTIFNWDLAVKAAKHDPDVRRIVQEKLYSMEIRPKLSQLVVPSYNRMAKLMNELPTYVPKKMIRGSDRLAR